MNTPDQTPDREPKRGPTNVRVIKSEDLLQDDREILINHHGEMYRLRLTKAGKLILNK